MIKVRCRTNLDLCGEKWPDALPAVPNVGDCIESETEHAGKFRLQLKVCRVTWKLCKPFESRIGEWVPEIELHMTDFQRGLPASRNGAASGSIVAFYEWYAPLVGKSVSSFI